MKVSCLFGISFFLFLKSTFFIIPLPHSLFTDLLFCDELPRFSFYLSFQFLTLWLGGVVFKGSGPNTFCGKIVPCLFFGAFGLVFVAIVISSSLIAFRGLNNLSVTHVEELTSSINWISTGIVSVSLGAYTARFLYVFLKSRVDSNIRNKLVFLLFVLSVCFAVFAARCIWALLIQIKANTLNEKLMLDFSDRCRSEQCLPMYVYHLVFYNIVDLCPTILLLLVFSMTSPSSSSTSSARTKTTARSTINMNDEKTSDGPARRKRKKNAYSNPNCDGIYGSPYTPLCSGDGDGSLLNSTPILTMSSLALPMPTNNCGFPSSSSFCSFCSSSSSDCYSTPPSYIRADCNEDTYAARTEAGEMGAEAGRLGNKGDAEGRGGGGGGGRRGGREGRGGRDWAGGQQEQQHLPNPMYGTGGGTLPLSLSLSSLGYYPTSFTPPTSRMNPDSIGMGMGGSTGLSPSILATANPSSLAFFPHSSPHDTQESKFIELSPSTYALRFPQETHQ